MCLAVSQELSVKVLTCSLLLVLVLNSYSLVTVKRSDMFIEMTTCA